MSLNLIRRLIKGAPLTAAEHDGNLDKLEDAIEASEATGAAAAAVAAHVAAADPHPQYLTPAEGNAAYATAAQGALATSAVQPGGLAPVATSGVYGDLSGRPTIPTAASATPQPLGTAAAGNGTNYARDNHVHAMPNAAGVGADPSGTAASAVSAHVAAADPHPGYALESALGTAAGLNHGTAAGDLVRLDPTTGQLPAVDGSQLTGLPTGGGLPSPGIPPWNAGSGSMIAPNNITTTPGTASAVAGAVEYHQVFIPEATTALALICRTGTAYAGTSDVMLGIYANAASRPAGKIADASLQITASGAATYAVTISQPLSPGWYWLAFLAVSVGATPAFNGCTANASGVGGGLFTELTPTAALVTSVRQTGQSSLPATAGSLTTSTLIRAVAFLGV
jgi:hypothetical protein